MIKIFFVLVKNGERYCYENIRENALELTISMGIHRVLKIQVLSVGGLLKPLYKPYKIIYKCDCYVMSLKSIFVAK